MRTPLVPRGATARKPSLRNIRGVPNQRHSGTAAIFGEATGYASTTPPPLLPPLAGRSWAKGVRPLIEDAPASSLLDGERFKIRKGTNAQLADRIRLALHDGRSYAAGRNEGSCLSAAHRLDPDVGERQDEEESGHHQMGWLPDRKGALERR